MTTTIDQTANRLREHQSTVSPGLPAHLSSAHSKGDVVAQGDLMICVADAVPDGYELIKNPTDADRQLVPDNGRPGSHHRLASFDGVELYRPKDWGKDDTDLRGPAVVFTKPNSIVHERGTQPHGTVFIDDPMTIVCRYQRNYDAEQKAARRAMD